jgi:hypothetical protein
MRAMQTMARIGALAATSCVLFLATSPALAFGGSAADLGKQGNFVISNRANLGFSQSFHGGGPTIDLAPELDYFIVPNVAIGGALILHHDDHNSTFGVQPQAAYHLVISDSWSFWPRLAVTLTAGSPGDVSVELSAPFLLHPVEHFFFGFGPSLTTDVTPPSGAHSFNAFGSTFIVGGYFDS